MRKEDNTVENDFISAQYSVDSTLMMDDVGSWIQMHGHGGGGRFEDKMKEVCHRRSRHAVWLTQFHGASTQVA